MGFLRQALLLGSFMVVPAFGVAVDPADVPNVSGVAPLSFTETFGIHYPAGTLFSSGEMGVGAKLVSSRSMELITPVTTALFDYDLTTEAIEEGNNAGVEIIAYQEQAETSDPDLAHELCPVAVKGGLCLDPNRKIKFMTELVKLTIPDKLNQQNFRIKFSERGSSAELPYDSDGVELDMVLKIKSQGARADTVNVGDKVAKLTIKVMCLSEARRCVKGHKKTGKVFIGVNEKNLYFIVASFKRVIDADKFPAGIYEVSYDVDFYIN